MRFSIGLVAAIAILTPLLAIGPNASAQTTTIRAAPDEKSVRPAANSTWAQRRKVAFRALRYAMRQRGKPYSWGAAGPDAFDCSGLTSWVYRKVGIALPRTTYEQHAAIHNKIAWKDLFPGDLVFFDADGHVGIVSKRIGDRIYMINAPHTGDHVREVLLDAYRRSTFSGAVRPY